MTDTVFERLRQGPSSNGKSSVRPEDVEKLKQTASNVSVPAITVNQRVWMPTVPVPEVKALSNDRRGRREAVSSLRL
jgi:putative N-acetylmannosamine-6-phosphate epimerase